MLCLCMMITKKVQYSEVVSLLLFSYNAVMMFVGMSIYGVYANTLVTLPWEPCGSCWFEFSALWILAREFPSLFSWYVDQLFDWNSILTRFVSNLLSCCDI